MGRSRIEGTSGRRRQVSLWHDVWEVLVGLRVVAPAAGIITAAFVAIFHPVSLVAWVPLFVFLTVCILVAWTRSEPLRTRRRKRRNHGAGDMNMGDPPIL
jgi:hypothetical protein